MDDDLDSRRSAGSAAGPPMGSLGKPAAALGGPGLPSPRSLQSASAGAGMQGLAGPSAPSPKTPSAAALDLSRAPAGSYTPTGEYGRAGVIGRAARGLSGAMRTPEAGALGILAGGSVAIGGVGRMVDGATLGDQVGGAARTALGLSAFLPGPAGAVGRIGSGVMLGADIVRGAYKGISEKLGSGSRPEASGSVDWNATGASSVGFSRGREPGPIERAALAGQMRPSAFDVLDQPQRAPSAFDVLDQPQRAPSAFDVLDQPQSAPDASLQLVPSAFDILDDPAGPLGLEAGQALGPAVDGQPAWNGDGNRPANAAGQDSVNFAVREAAKAREREEVDREHIEYVNDLAQRSHQKAAEQTEKTRMRSAITKRRTATLLAEMRSAFPDDLMSEAW